MFPRTKHACILHVACPGERSAFLAQHMKVFASAAINSNMSACVCTFRMTFDIPNMVCISERLSDSRIFDTKHILQVDETCR